MKINTAEEEARIRLVSNFYPVSFLFHCYSGVEIGLRHIFS